MIDSEALSHFKEWIIINIVKIADINSGIIADKEEFIRESEERYKKEIENAAKRILDNSAEKPIVLVSGPSGSGKTTSAGRVEKILRENGCGAYTISMDNYFLPDNCGVEFPRNPDGTTDLESPYRLDIPLLQKHLDMLNDGTPIDSPIFNFKTRDRDGTIHIERKKGDVIILEGIHALNPEVTGESKNYATCIYVSVRTRIENSQNDRLHPRLIRLLRRLGRDKLYRGRDMRETFDMFKSVSRGEETYIMPYKKLADFDIDTFIPFEPAIYRWAVYDDLKRMKEEMLGDFDYDIILSFLDELEAVDRVNVPSDSLIREFVGE